jgi:hypothetical protein
MNILYETPNKRFIITSQSDPEWIDIFGDGSVCYNVSKRKDDYFILSGEPKDLYEIVYSTVSLGTAIRWLRWIKVISTDEMKYQLSLLVKKEK